MLVLGGLRLGVNADYDHILELAKELKTLRKMYDHGDWADKNLHMNV
jgi:IS5 family transposase